MSFLKILFIFLFALLFSGCLTPAVRYSSRHPDAPKISKNSYVVKPGWDYRKFYKVPRNRLKEIVDSYLGTPYRWGGNTRNGIDCSGLVNEVFKELNHAKLPRTSRRLAKLGVKINRRSARPGDLVFFRTGVFKRVNHVGIYFENGLFAHASSKKGVIYSSLDDTYYKKHFYCIRKIF